MPRKIAIQLEDGQIITYQTNAQNDKEVVAEIKRLFPFAKTWHKEVRIDSENFLNFSLDQPKHFNTYPTRSHRRWAAPLILLILVVIGLYFKDAIYTEIQVQIIRYQIKKSIIEMLRREPVVVSAPTITTPGSKRSDIGVVSSTQQEIFNFVEVTGKVQNFGSRSYDSIKVQAIFYDERGNEVLTTFGFVEPNVLEARAQGSFDITAENVEGKIHFYKLMILD